MGFNLSDFLEDTGKGIVNKVEDTAVGGANTVKNAWANLDDLWKLNAKQTEANWEVPYQLTSNVLSQPFDINSWTDPVEDWGRKTDKIGRDTFGEGGYVKGGLDAVGLATIGVPVGTVAVQTADRVQGKPYDGGKAQPYLDLYGMYNAATSAGSGNTPSNGGGISGSNTGYTPDYGSGIAPGNTEYSQGNTINLGTNGEQMGSSFEGVNGVDPNIGVSNAQPGDSFWSGLQDSWNNVTKSANSPLGKSILGALDPTGLSKVATATGEGGGWNQAIDGLATLYKGYQSRRQAAQTKEALDNQLNSALGLYAPGSAYATQLEKELMARDAAAGRRSQYGSRAVELAAKLADRQAAVRQTYMNQAPTIASMNQQIAGAKNAGLSNLFNVYSKNSKQINSAVRGGLSSLYDYISPSYGQTNYSSLSD